MHPGKSVLLKTQTNAPLGKRSGHLSQLLEPLCKRRIGFLAVEFRRSHPPGSLPLFCKLPAIRRQRGNRPGERGGVAGRVGQSCRMLLDHLLQFTGKGADDRQAGGRVFAGLVGNRDQRLGLHEHEPDIGRREKSAVFATVEKPVDDDPAWPPDACCSRAENLLEASASRDVNLGRGARG